MCSFKTKEFQRKERMLKQNANIWHNYVKGLYNSLLFLQFLVRLMLLQVKSEKDKTVAQNQCCSH